jgi:protein SCO1
MRKTMLAVAIAALLAVVCGTASADDAEATKVNGRFVLTDTAGRAVSDESFSGRLRLVAFGYTFCPDICPTTLNTLSVVNERLGADAAKVAVLFITVDPERDTPQHLKEYLAVFPGIIGLTGTLTQVEGAARNFRVRFEKQVLPGTDPAGYVVDHSAGIYLMDREGNFIARMNHAMSPEKVLDRVQTYLR